MFVIVIVYVIDEDLYVLGFRKRSDFIRLRRFCMEEVQELENKERLNEKKDFFEKILEKNKLKRRFGNFQQFVVNIREIKEKFQNLVV